MNSNQLKIIAAISMVIDHIGYFLLPEALWLRMIGRIAFPIFAYFIAEGCIHTKNIRKYFLDVLLLGLICFVITIVASNTVYANILITFALSILIIMTMQNLRKECSDVVRKETSVRQKWKRVISYLYIVCALAGTFALSRIIMIDYGFAGVMVPVLVWLFKTFPPCKKDGNKAILNRTGGILGLSIGLLLVSFFLGGIQYLCLITIPLMALYNGERGRKSLKNFFYVFYPLHIGVIQSVVLFLAI